MKHLIILLICLFFWTEAVAAQAPADIEAVLSETRVTVGEACRWVYADSGLIDFGASDAEVLALAIERKTLPLGAYFGDNDYIRLEGLSRLVVDAYGIKGGVMYRVTRARRYAFRELVYMAVLRRIDDPKDFVSGQRLLEILKYMEIIQLK